jgi:hypothetical protein
MTPKLVDIASGYVPAFIPFAYDQSGQFAFSPDSLSVSYTYDTSSNLQSETRGPDLAGNYYKKTYTFTNGQLTAESMWVKQ